MNGLLLVWAYECGGSLEMWIGLFFSNVRGNLESCAELISGNMDSTFQIKFGLVFVILLGLFALTKIINRKKFFNFSLLSVK